MDSTVVSTAIANLILSLFTLLVAGSVSLVWCWLIDRSSKDSGYAQGRWEDWP